MKSLILIAILTLAYITGYSQDPKLPSERCLIVSANNKHIKSVRLWNITEGRVEYEQNGSLHDIPVDQIKVIKLDDEIVTFNSQGQMEIRPYDLIISGSDTIICLITRMNTANIYFYKQKGFHKADYIAQHQVDFIYKHPDTSIFHSFQDKYVLLDLGKAEGTLSDDRSEAETPEVIKAHVDIEESHYIEYHTQPTLQRPGAGRVIGQVLVGTVLGATGTIAGAIGGGIALGLVGFIAGPTGAAIGAAIGAGIGGAAGFGLGTGLGVYKVGNSKDVQGRFGPAVGGAYLGLLGSAVIALVAGGTGIGVFLIVVAPAIISTIAFNKSRKIKSKHFTSIIYEKEVKRF